MIPFSNASLNARARRAIVENSRARVKLIRAYRTDSLGQIKEYER